MFGTDTQQRHNVFEDPCPDGVFEEMEVSQSAIWVMEYGKVSGLGTGHGLTALEEDLGNSRNLKQNRGLSPGKPSPGHPVSPAFLADLFAWGYNKNKAKQTLHWQEISPDKRPSSGGSSQAPTARKLGEALKKCQPAPAAEPGPFACHRVSGVPGWSQSRSRSSRLVKTI